MKGLNDEQKILAPLFPRLHVNDTEKGGPRAPPRNKMALYEQLSIPSQRYSSVTSGSVPSASSSQGDHEKSVFPPCYASAAPSHFDNTIGSHSSDEMSTKTTTAEVERKTSNNSIYGMKLRNSLTEIERYSSKKFNNIKSVTEVGKKSNLSSSVECTSYEPDKKKFVGEDDISVPTYVQSAIMPCPPNKEQQDKTKRNVSEVNMQKAGNSMIIISDEHLKNNFENDVRHEHVKLNTREDDNTNENVRRKASIENPVPHHLLGQRIVKFGDKIHLDDSINVPEHQSKEHTHNQEENAKFRKTEHVYNDSFIVEPGYTPGVKLPEKESTLKRRIEFYPRISTENSSRCSNEAETSNVENEDIMNSSYLERKEEEDDDDISETSMVESTSREDICPDDVVGRIGPKEFWKARRLIANHQRIFALQLFELHRLIKVQESIAASPHLLLKEDPCLSKTSLVLSPNQEIQRQEDTSNKKKHNTKNSTENAVTKASVPPIDQGMNKWPSQTTSCGPYSTSISPSPKIGDNQTNAWSFHPPANQWLVPVMSPSEGLVYKPYSGPFPPTTGFMMPIYGNCSPFGLPQTTGNFKAPAYGAPVTHLQQGVNAMPIPNCFPPYGLPVMNPITSAPVIEQANHSRSQHPNQRAHLPEDEIKVNSRSSHNMPYDRSGEFSWTTQRSKDGELQGSTASSPFEKERGGTKRVSKPKDALSLFPMARTSKQPEDLLLTGDKKDQPSHVIRVVPYKSTSATESAARIFRSIQQEKHLDAP